MRTAVVAIFAVAIVLSAQAQYEPCGKGEPCPDGECCMITFVNAAEQVTLKLPASEAEEIHQEMCSVLTKTKLPKSNIAGDERLALKQLREDDNIVVLPADKGNATIVLKKAGRCDNFWMTRHTHQKKWIPQTSQLCKIRYFIASMDASVA